MKALAHNIIVKPLPPENEITASGIEVLNHGYDRAEYAEVVSVGDLVREVKPGQRIVYHKDTVRSTFERSLQEYKTISESMVLGIVE